MKIEKCSAQNSTIMTILKGSKLIFYAFIIGIFSTLLTKPERECADSFTWEFYEKIWLRFDIPTCNSPRNL